MSVAHEYHTVSPPPASFSKVIARCSLPPPRSRRSRSGVSASRRDGARISSSAVLIPRLLSRRELFGFVTRPARQRVRASQVQRPLLERRVLVRLRLRGEQVGRVGLFPVTADRFV